MKLRLSNHLIVFGLICLAPVVLAGALVGYDLARKERARLERQTVNLVQDRQRVIDADLGRLIGMLEALATVRSIDQQDWATFRSQARTVAAKAGAPIVLRDLEARLIVSTDEPADAERGRVSLNPVLRAADRKAVATGKPVVSDLLANRLRGRPHVAAVVPVMRDGAPAYLLSVAIPSERIAGRLRLGPLASTKWLGSVAGSDLRIIARTREAESFVGSAATGEVARRLAEQPEGTLISRTLDGQDVFTAFQRTDMGWWVVVSAPLDELHRPLRAVVLVLVSIIGAVLLVTVLMAWTYGSMLGREVCSLRENARAMGQDAPLHPYAHHIEEVAEVQQALFDAQAKVEQLIAELNHRVKNTLTVIKVLARRSVGSRRDRDAVTARISALTIAHEALTQTHWRGADLGKLVLAIARSADATVAASGPAVRLMPKAAVALAQVLQELVCNACQHGALRERSGRVELSWTVENEDLRLVWAERTPLKPQAPDHAAGFGLQIIELCVVRQLGGRLSIGAAPEGWTVSFEFPLSGELGLMAEVDGAAALAQEAGQASRQA